VRDGVAELAGFPAVLLAGFSTRGGETRGEFAQLVAGGSPPTPPRSAGRGRPWPPTLPASADEPHRDPTFYARRAGRSPKRTVIRSSLPSSDVATIRTSW